jgi:hypothetical protein
LYDVEVSNTSGSTIFNQKPKKMREYEFIQHASPSMLESHPKKVIISAENAEEANKFAEKQGIYFDGVINGSDCPCCGDRWSRAIDETKTIILYNHACGWQDDSEDSYCPDCDGMGGPWPYEVQITVQ